jgi:surface antigen
MTTSMTIGLSPRKTGLFAVALSGALLVAGCQNTGQNEMIGTGAGAAGGALIGGLAGGWTGAAIGGLAGGVAGNLFGRYLDDRERQRAYAAAQQAAAENRRVNWNEQGGASGYVRPMGANYASGGRTCHDFEQVATKNGNTERQVQTMCRNPDGSWSAQA